MVRPKLFHHIKNGGIFVGMPAHIRFLWPICPLNFVQNYYETGVAYCCPGVDFIQKICYHSIGKWYGAVYFNEFFYNAILILTASFVTFSRLAFALHYERDKRKWNCGN